MIFWNASAKSTFGEAAQSANLRYDFLDSAFCKAVACTLALRRDLDNNFKR